MNSRLSFLLVPLVSLVASAQDTTKHDPLADKFGGHPVLANSVEIISLTDSATGPSTRIPALRVLDVNAAKQLVADGRQMFPSATFSTDMYSDCIAEDFDGDGYAEIVVARVLPFTAGSSGAVVLERIRPGRQKPGYTWEWTQRETLLTTYNANGPLKLMAARLTYSPTRYLVVVSINGTGTRLTVYSGTGPFTQVMYQSFDTGAMSELSFGDFNGDGIDDLIRVAFGNDGTYDRLYYGTYYYNATTKYFNWDKSMGFVSGSWASWKRLRIITGDFRHVGHDEAVIALTVISGNTSRPVFLYCDMTQYWPFAQASIPGTSPAGYAWGAGWESDAVRADLNPFKGDGDELVVAGPGEIGVLKFNSSLQPYFLAKMAYPTANAVETYPRRHFVAAGDMDPDTNSTVWLPEIVVAEHKPDSTTVFRTLQVTQDANFTITGLSQKWAVTPATRSAKSEMVAGDLDGDAMRFGPPTLATVDNFYQPIVMMCVPPTHFDYLNGRVVDVCKVYGASPSEFRVSYTETQGTTTHFQSNVSHSWGVSAEISGGFKVFGVGVSAYAKAAYDGGYYNNRSVDTTFTTTQMKQSTGDDWILATISNIEFWEYPIHALGKVIGSYLVQIPHLVGTNWIPSRSVVARNWVADREVGNLFSYLPSQKAASWSGQGLLTTFPGQYISIASAGNWTLNLATQTLDENKLTHKVEAEVGASVSGWGCEAKVSGKYGYEAGSTHSLTATKNVTIDIHVSETDKTFGDADYKVTPYIHWGSNGALVIDYAVDPSSLGDSTLGTFWDRNYLSRPDPALILPWRLDSLKGIGETEAIRLYSKSLHVSPSAPSPGDVVHISATVYNFSLINTAGPVKVRLYLGDPDAGGTPIVGSGGNVDLTTAGAIPARERATVQTDWTVPGGLSPNARIYALVDPDNAIAEVHEDNNKGFVSFRSTGTTGVEKEDPPEMPEQFGLNQNYPNPFNPSTVVSYQVPVVSRVKLTVYDMLGREVATLVDGVVDAGLRHAVFSAAGLASGVYIYRLHAVPMGGGKEFAMTKRMILVR